MLIAVDRSDYASMVIEHGLDHARRVSADEVHFVTVVRDDSEREDARRWLDALAADLLDAFGCTATPSIHVVTGLPAATVIAVARELHPDVLVIGRFDVPSRADVILDWLDVPTLVVGPEGTDLEPQCPACARVRRETDAEHLFCTRHDGDYIPDLVTRLPARFTSA